MLSILFGNEPYLINDIVKKVQKEVSDISFAQFNDFTDNVIEFAAQYPFYDGKQVAIVYIPILDKNELLMDYIENQSETTDIYIIAGEVDRRTSLYKKLKKENLLQECNKLSPDLYKKFILREIGRDNRKIDNNNFLFFLERSSYLESEDVTLYTIIIYLKQLGYSNKDGIISKNDIETLIPETLDQKSILLAKFLLQKEESSMFNLAKSLIEQKENPITMLSLIARSFRLAYKASLYEDHETKDISILLGVPTYQFLEGLKYKPAVLEESLDVLQNGVNQIKDGEAKPEHIFYITLGTILSLLKEEIL